MATIYFFFTRKTIKRTERVPMGLISLMVDGLLTLITFVLLRGYLTQF